VTIEDELALQRLLAEYCHRIDDADFIALADLFTVDGSFAWGDEVASGGPELAIWFEGRQPLHRRGKHVSVNPVIDVDGDRARVVSDYLFVRWIKGALTIETTGRYVDRCVKIDGRWLIQRRDAEMLLPPPPR
jgi:hypothetical protein